MDSVALHFVDLCTKIKANSSSRNRAIALTQMKSSESEKFEFPVVVFSFKNFVWTCDLQHVKSLGSATATATRQASGDETLTQLQLPRPMAFPPPL